MHIQCAFNSICFGCASEAHHNELHVKAPLVSCVSKYFKVLEKHFVTLKVLEYQYKYLAYVLEYIKSAFKSCAQACLSTSIPQCFVPSPWLNCLEHTLPCSKFFRTRFAVHRRQGNSDSRAQEHKGLVLSTKTLRSHLLGNYTV